MGRNVSQLGLACSLQSVRQARTLPLAGKKQLSFLATAPDWILPLLAEPGSEAAILRYGREQFRSLGQGLFMAESTLYRRYVLGWEAGQLAALGPVCVIARHQSVAGFCGLEVRLPTSKCQRPLLERIYTLPERRRKGHASLLLACASEDFADLALDGKFTREGAAFFGYTLPEQGLP